VAAPAWKHNVAKFLQRFLAARPFLEFIVGAALRGRPRVETQCGKLPEGVATEGHPYNDYEIF